MRIDTKPLTVVLIRMVALYLVANGVLDLVRLLGMPDFWEQADTQIKILVLSSLFAPLVVAVLLWFSSSRIATWIAPDSKTLWLPEEKALVSAGTFLIGLYWAVSALRAFYGLFAYGLKQSYPWLIVLVGAIVLMLGSNSIGRFYTWLRTAGLSHDRSANANADDAG